MWITVSIVLSIVVNTAQGDHEHHTFVGCFNTSYFESYGFYYKISQSLSIEESLAACRQRMTRYMGLQVDPSSLSYHVVFCGNDLAEKSHKKWLVQCIPCPDTEGWICGKNGVMSVYMLKETNDPALLLMTDTGVELLENNTVTVRVSYNITSAIANVDYIYTKDEIIYSVGRNLLRSIYNYHVMKYDTTVPKNITSYFMGIGVDFLQNEIYSGRIDNNDVFKINFDDQISVVTADLSSFTTSVLIDPYKRLLFTPGWDYPIIYRYDIRIGELGHVSTHKFNVKRIHVMCLDHHQQLLFGVVSLIGDRNKHLVSWDYECTKMHVLYNGPDIQKFNNNTYYHSILDVYKATVTWVSLDDNRYIVYMCTLTPHCRSEDVVAVYNSSVKIFSLKIYHPERQTPGNKTLCGELTCQYICETVSTFTAKCVCPFGQILGQDGSSCEMPSYLSTESDMELVSYTSPSTERAIDGNNSHTSNYKHIMIYVTASNIIILLLLVTITILVAKLYTKQSQTATVKWRKDDQLGSQLLIDQLN